MSWMYLKYERLWQKLCKKQDEDMRYPYIRFNHSGWEFWIFTTSIT